MEATAVLAEVVVRFVAMVFLMLCFSFPAEGRGKKRLALQYRSKPTQSTSRTRVRKPRKRPSKNWLGFLGGVNFSYADTYPEGSGSTRNGISLVFQYERQITPYLLVQSNIAYTQRGVRTTLFQVAGLPINGAVKLNYLEFPLLLKLRSQVYRSKPQFYGSAGPHMAVATSRGAEVFGLVDVDTGNRFRAGDFGFVIAVGGTYRLSRRMRLTVELRNTFGLVDLDKSADSYRTRGHQVLSGLAWSF